MCDLRYLLDNALFLFADKSYGCSLCQNGRIPTYNHTQDMYRLSMLIVYDKGPEDLSRLTGLKFQNTLSTHQYGN
jgi:hypothetical protein